MIIISTQCFYPGKGGIEDLMTGMAKAFEQNGQDVFVYADGISSDKDKILPFKIKRFNQWKPIRRRAKANEINNLIKIRKVNFIIADSWKSVEYLKSIDVKIIVLAHGSEILKLPYTPINIYKRYKKNRILKSFNKAKIIVANSNYTQNLIKGLNVDPNKIKIIHPGIESFDGKIKEDISDKVKKIVEDKSPIILTLARLEKRKGHLLVIEALSRLKTKYPNLLYIIAGEGNYKDNIIKHAISFDLLDNIKFVGWIKEPEKTLIIKKSDLLVMTPGLGTESVESFGMAFIDGSLNGVATLGTDNGGMSDAILDGQTGLIAKTGDVEDITIKIDQILSDNSMRKKFGKNGIEFTAKTFPWKYKIREYLNLI